MASYKVAWKQSARKELRKLEREAILRILKAVEALAADPYPPGARKLTGSEHTYRIRTGDYRIVYNVLSSTLVIEIIRVGHRKNIYK